MTTTKDNGMSGNMPIHDTPADGWVGGFAESNPAFEYPNPDLTSLPILGNLDNIDKLERQMKVLWPEFSWQTEPGNEDSRCFQMFAPDISRLGYTNEGRVYSIICPQQGAYSKHFGAFNVEVTVTGQRGWANESARQAEMMAADMSVVGVIWFSDTPDTSPLLKKLRKYADFKFRGKNYNFPFSKESAIKVRTHKVGNKKQVLFPLRTGLSERFTAPDFTRHDDEAFTVSNLDVQIGNIIPTGDAEIDAFNQGILDLFNVVKGNMLKAGNILTWNVWFEAPTVVDQKEWADHAEYWRTSIDTDHGSPGGSESKVRKADGTVYHPLKEFIFDAVKKLMHYTDRVSLLSNRLLPGETSQDNKKCSLVPAPGWIGGYKNSNPCFPLEKSRLIGVLTGTNPSHEEVHRQLKVFRSELSWQCTPGVESSRLFQVVNMTEPFIGYTSEGKILTVSSPIVVQSISSFGGFNIEFSVVNAGGWIDETNSKAQFIGCDLTFEARVWFDDAEYSSLFSKLNDFAKTLDITSKLPTTREGAILVELNRVDDSSHGFITLKSGFSEKYQSRLPTDFYRSANLEICVGKHQLTGNSKLNTFNKSIIKLINACTGNFLGEGTILSWNFTFHAPVLAYEPCWTKESLPQKTSKIYKVDKSVYIHDKEVFSKSISEFGHYIEIGNSVEKSLLTTVPAPGWVGGCNKSIPGLLYPNPCLDSLTFMMQGASPKRNERQMIVKKSQFSWCMKDEASRLFRQFSNSNISYSDTGVLYSLASSSTVLKTEVFGSIIFEVSVSMCRGWIDEDGSPAQGIAGDVVVECLVWFDFGNASTMRSKQLESYFISNFSCETHEFPSSRKCAIVVETHSVGNKNRKFVALRSGVSESFDTPTFADHSQESFSVSNVEFEIKGVRSSGCKEIDAFYETVLTLVNSYSGNLLTKGKVISWNLWLEAPTLNNSYKSQSNNEVNANYYRDHNTNLADCSTFQPGKEIIRASQGSLLHFCEKVAPNSCSGCDLHCFSAPGWQGGFEEANSEVSYPNPDLTNLFLSTNRDRKFSEIKRQLKVLWPELSWLTNNGERISQAFSSSTLKIGYSPDGRVHSISPAQILVQNSSLGEIIIQIEAIAQRGWINELSAVNAKLAIDTIFEASIWFTEAEEKPPLLQKLKQEAEDKLKWEDYKFPSSKKHAIVIELHKAGNSRSQLVPIRSGLSEGFLPPTFARHDDESYCTSHFEFEVGDIKRNINSSVNEYNQSLLESINGQIGNLFRKGNIVSSNLWFEAPSLIDGHEWEHELEAVNEVVGNERSRDKVAFNPRYKDGSIFESVNVSEGGLNKQKTPTPEVVSRKSVSEENEQKNKRSQVVVEKKEETQKLDVEVGKVDNQDKKESAVNNDQTEISEKVKTSLANQVGSKTGVLLEAHNTKEKSEEGDKLHEKLGLKGLEKPEVKKVQKQVSEGKPEINQVQIQVSKAIKKPEVALNEVIPSIPQKKSPIVSDASSDEEEDPVLPPKYHAEDKQSNSKAKRSRRRRRCVLF